MFLSGIVWLLTRIGNENCWPGSEGINPTEKNLERKLSIPGTTDKGSVRTWNMVLVLGLYHPY
jgi:hypothetical protein